MLFRCDKEDDCPDGSDEWDCESPEACADEMFLCNNGMCIPANWQCDRINDCDNDEDNCEITPVGECPPELFFCGPLSKECIVPRRVCDGYPDCRSDGVSDEEGCTYIVCAGDSLACPGPDSCVDECDQCDGKVDCVDGSDEIGCDYVCEENQYRCLDGEECISYDSVCDGYSQCDDDSDEIFCDYVKPIVCETFPCANGYECLPVDLQCNKAYECADASDEWFCSYEKVTVDECATDNGGCEGTCHDTPHSFYCTCSDGYRVDPHNHKACIDVDECEEVGICSQVCSNTDGGYACSCVDGYERSSTNGCVASGGSADPYLLFTNKYDIQRVNLKTLSVEKVIVNLSSAMGIDYHYRLGQLFWSDVIEGAIMTAALDGTNQTTIVEGLTRPEGLAVDWIHDKLFWTDSLKGTVEVAHLDGSFRAVLYSGLNFPRGIAVDPFKGALYWTEHEGLNPAIKYGPVDGSESDHLHANGLFFPSALSLDIPSQTIYWVDSLSHVIEASLTSQKGRRPIYTKSVNSSFGLTHFEDTMYWTEKKKGTIMAVNRLDGTNSTVILGDIYSPLDVVTVHPLRQPPAIAPNPCSIDNGGCSYLCLVVNGNRSCVCSDDSNLLKDGVSCSDTNPIMLFSVTDEIRKSFLHSDQGAFDELLPLEFATPPDIVALAWESKNDTVFWADSESRSISSATIEGLHQQVIVDVDVKEVGGMAVDWITCKLYWTDHNLEAVFVSDLDGSRKTALITPLVLNGQPTDLVVDAVHGWMFWGMRGTDARIMRANLDGSGIMTVIEYSELNLSEDGEGYPIAMAMDYQLSRLYWVDHNRNSLFSMELDGSDLKLISMEPASPVGLAENKGSLYYLEQNTKSIFSISKSPPYKIEEYLENTANHLRALTVFHHERERLTTHPCWDDNGGCSYLCLTDRLNDDGTFATTCACPTGLLLSEDRKTCKSEPQKYFVFAGESRLSWLSSDTNYDFESTIPISPSPERVSAIEVDWDHSKVYWVDPSSAVIYRADLMSGEKEVVVDKGLLRPTAIALDWAGQKLYWADSGTRRIEVSYTDGSSRRVLVNGNNVDQVISLALDLKLHYIFWISSGKNPQVQRAGMDGEGHMTVVESPDVTSPQAITIDNQESSGRIIVADASNKIYAFNTEGKDKVILASLQYPPVGVAVDDRYIYWIHGGDARKLYRAQKFTGNDMEPLARNLEPVNAFQIAFQRDRGLLHYPCVNVKQCSDICLPNSDHEYYTCACPTGIKLNPDQSSCPQYPSRYLLFPMSSLVGRISLDTQDFSEVVLASIKPPSEVSFIDYFLTSPEGGRLIWSQGTDIMTSDLDGNNSRPLLSSLGTPQGIAVDWTTGNVYYTDSTSGTIEVVSEDGSYRKLLVQIDDGQPIGLTVLPQQGKLFWSSWTNGGGARIEVATMNGSDRSVLVATDLSRPSQLVIDGEFLYWVDTTMNTLERVKLDGTGREEVFAGLSKPFGLAILDESVFWSDQETGRIVKEQKSIQLGKEVYVDVGLGVPRGLAIVSMGRPGELDDSQLGGPCSYANGNCTHFCLPLTSAERVCACPDTPDSHLLAWDCVEQTGVPPPRPPPTAPPATTSDMATDYPTSTSSSSFGPSTTDDDIGIVKPPSPPDSSASPSTVDTTENNSYKFTPVEIAFLSVIVAILMVIVVLVGAIFFMAINQKSEYNSTMSHTGPASLQLLQVKNPLYQEVSAKDVPPAKASSVVYNNAKASKGGSGGSVKPLVPKRLPSSRSSESSGPVKISSATATSLGLQYHGVEPSTYRITPVPPRRKSASSPPGSPIVARADVHFSLDTSQKKQLVTPTRTASSHHREVQQEGRKGKAYRPPPVAPKELSVRVSGSKKSVKFVPEVDLSNPLPPPLPPRVPASSTPPSYEELGSLPTPSHSRRSISSPSSSEDGEETTLFLGKSAKPSVPTVSISATNPHAVSPDRPEEDSDCELPPRPL